jgi:hypothetical protein
MEIPSQWWDAIPAALTWRHVLSALEEEVIRRVAQMPPAHRLLKMQQRGLEAPAQYTPVHRMVQEGFTTFIASIPEIVSLSRPIMPSSRPTNCCSRMTVGSSL